MNGWLLGSVDFVFNFEKIFGIKKFKIFVTGESYGIKIAARELDIITNGKILAGRYVPYISAAMFDKKNPEYFNVSGASLRLVIRGEC